MTRDAVRLHRRPLRGDADLVAEVTERVRAEMRAEECPACEGRGGTQRDEWGYEIDPCPACGGDGLRALDAGRDR